MTLKERYQKKVVPKLLEKLSLRNPLAVPRPIKIVVNMGIGSRGKKEVLAEAQKVLSAITGQWPKICKARQSEAGFSLHKGEAVGLMGTLRKQRMWDFLEKLIRVVLPQNPNFEGVDEKNLDEEGNLNLGFEDQGVFSEVDPHEIKHILGLGVNIVTTADNKEEGYLLFKELGIPFKNG